MKTEQPNWLVCQAHTSAECWSTLVLMLQLTPELEAIWRKSMVALTAALQVAEIKELQVYAPMRVVDLETIEEWKVTPEYYREVLVPLEDNTEWREITDDQAQTLFHLGKELNLEFGRSHLKVWPRTDTVDIRACTSAKHVDDDIFGLDDLQPELLKAFTLHPALV